jgi:hypothetical protein
MSAVSAKQYGFMQAHAHDTSTTGDGPSAEVAREFIEKTPSEKRSEYARVLAKRRKGRGHGRSGGRS